MKPVISVIFTAGSGVETCRTKLAGQTFKEYEIIEADRFAGICLLYTSPSPRDA